jgi:hypothetical protein
MFAGTAKRRGSRPARALTGVFYYNLPNDIAEAVSGRGFRRGVKTDGGSGRPVCLESSYPAR